MGIRIEVDTDPHYPLRHGGQFGGQLKQENGSPVKLIQGQDNDLDFGIFHQGVWIATEPWDEIWIELKALVNGGHPSSGAASLHSVGAATTTDALLSGWQAGTAQHARVVVLTADVDALAVGELWMIITVGDDVGNEQATIAAGRVEVVEN